MITQQQYDVIRKDLAASHFAMKTMRSEMDSLKKSTRNMVVALDTIHYRITGIEEKLPRQDSRDKIIEIEKRLMDQHGSEQN